MKKNKNKNNQETKTYSVAMGYSGEAFPLDDDCPLCRQMRTELHDGRLRKTTTESGIEVFELIEN